MKKFLAILLAAALMFALAACGGSTAQIKDATTDEEAADISPKDYDKDFDGLQDYLLDKGYIFGRDGNGNSLTAEVYYDIVGAKDGIRYYFTDGRTFVELYDFSGELNDTAKAFLEDAEDDGKLYIIDGLDEMTAVISDSGKYVIAYNANNKYDYDKITDELENW